jgi:copper homeostasis protein (lipoprotein)
MNRKVFIILMAALAIFGLGFCLSNKGAVDSHISKNSLDWAGVYTGTIPAASASGINVRLQLNKDNTYELTYDYIDRPGNSFTNTGSFKWNDTGDIINLGIAETPSYYQTAKNKLIQLDMEGKLITGKLADNYVLTKER